MRAAQTMKKSFPLQDPARDQPRVIEAVKHDVRKYLKRERRKTPPEGFELWEFNCRVGPDPATAVSKTVKELIDAIDAVALAGSTTVYIEIIAVPAKWPARIAPAAAAPGEESPPL
jgi:Family of unknown function (DUF6172)